MKPILERKANIWWARAAVPRQHGSPVTTNRAHHKYEPKDPTQKAEQKDGGGRFIAFNYFCLKVSSGAQARNILYFPLPGANVKHTWKTHFMLITY